MLLAVFLPKAWLPAALVTGVFYVIYSIIPVWNKFSPVRLNVLAGGYELILSCMICFLLECFLYAYLITGKTEAPSRVLTVNALVFWVLLTLLLLNGIIRTFICSKQLGIMPRIMLVLFWWVPVFNIILLRKFFYISGKEYKFTSSRLALNKDRKSEELCKTRYPILMVHGIFFRDWERFNYWGRVPGELCENGAVIYYGNHHSSSSVESCAEELRDCILNITAETGCEKVNIIAHSKGGLDSRYAISCLGMGGYVASLTTINTPHYGCSYVGKILEVLPKKAINAMENSYSAVFKKLGDTEPDFFGGLKNLTDRECARLNKIMPDYPGVLYQSVASRMKSRKSAMFPLNVGYSTIRLSGGGQNDGLVAVKSMAWGDFLGVLTAKGKLGISHGDMIDLTRKDIAGFDICEFYIDLVSGLKRRGL